MNRLLSILVLMTWGLWTGGLTVLALIVMTLAHTFRTDATFATVRDDGFGAAAGPVFQAFEKGQLVLAAAALVLTFAWRLCPGAAKLKTALFAAFALATVGAFYTTKFVTPDIERMRVEKQTKTPQFDKAHKTSEGTYKGMLVALVAGGVLVPFVIAHEEKARRERAAESTIA